MRSGKTKSLACLLVLALAVGLLWAQPPSNGPRRVPPPRFDQASREVFFPDAFKVLQGERPGRGAPPPVAGSGPAEGPVEPQKPKGQWQAVISASTLEDEVKRLKIELEKLVTTPRQFASETHRPARRSFSLLAMLFGIISEYDGDVRWKAEADKARTLLATVALNAKAGGSPQVYEEARKRLLDLEDLLQGGSIQSTPNRDPATWENTVERPPLMQLLEQRLEKNLKQWTASEDEFKANAEGVFHEAELTAAIAAVLMQEAMPDGSDEEYRAFARSMLQGARTIAESARRGEYGPAREAMAQVSQACNQCHESYR